MVEHHGVGGVDGVGPGEQLYPILDGILGLVVEFQDGKAHQGAHTLGVQLQGTLKGQPGRGKVWFSAEVW